MQDTKGQVIITIIAAIAVLLFIGILFLVMIWAYNNKKRQMERDKRQIQDDFEKQLLQSKLEMQEETFNTISQEIHDNVGQMLSLAKIRLNILEQQVLTGVEGLEEVKEIIGSAMTDLRNIAKSLSSERIHLLSLPDCIREEIRRLHNSGLLITFHLEGEEQVMEKQVKLILFRIIQEALQNILKHASASNVKILFSYLPGLMQISVTDDGVGFDVNSPHLQLNGLGLQNIRNRTTLIGGVSSIHSVINGGTTITINIPYA
ncbi:ATP-binding protein [Chitinophaga niabensis]|uniref:sensor histidine kinase n=1 Tax=Chitinophaga niabensis TaxID=536979 RepID=UPI0031BA8042